MTDSKSKPSSDRTPNRTIREIPSNDLFQGNRTIVISHAGEQYRLMITRNDKLILQK